MHVRGAHNILSSAKNTKFFHFLPKKLTLYENHLKSAIWYRERLTPPDSIIKIASNRGGLERTGFISSVIFFLFFGISFLIGTCTHSSGCFEAFSLFSSGFLMPGSSGLSVGPLGFSWGLEWTFLLAQDRPGIPHAQGLPASSHSQPLPPSPCPWQPASPGNTPAI